MTDLSDIFAKDPLEYSKADLETVVAEMRKSRKGFLIGNMKAGSTKAPTKTEKAAASILDKISLDL